MFQRVEDAGGDGRARVGACGDQRWMMRVGVTEAIVVYGKDQEMVWCKVIVQRVEDAGGDGRARVGARGDQRWMMRVGVTEVQFGSYDT